MSESNVPRPPGRRPYPSPVKEAKKALAKAKEEAGGNAGLARLLREHGIDISAQAVSQWKQVPRDRVLIVERVTGIPRYVLRPDFYPRDAAASARA